jgi:hypothetical protein
MNEFRKRCECWYFFGGEERHRPSCHKCQGHRLAWALRVLRRGGMKQPGNHRCFKCEGTGLVGVKHEEGSHE